MQSNIDGEENARLGEKNSTRAEKIKRKKKINGKRKEARSTDQSRVGSVNLNSS